MKDAVGNNGSYRDDVLKRLRRVEGQVKGVQKMIEENKCCVDILVQIAAIRSAVNRVGSMVLENYSKNCLQNAVTEEDREKALSDLVDTVQKFLRFVD